MKAICGSMRRSSSVCSSIPQHAFAQIHLIACPLQRQPMLNGFITIVHRLSNGWKLIQPGFLHAQVGCERLPIPNNPAICPQRFSSCSPPLLKQCHLISPAGWKQAHLLWRCHPTQKPSTQRHPPARALPARSVPCH